MTRVQDIPVGTCAGCLRPVDSGQKAQVNVTSQGHTISVEAHDTTECRNNAHKTAMKDPTWKNNPSYKN